MDKPYYFSFSSMDNSDISKNLFSFLSALYIGINKPSVNIIVTTPVIKLAGNLVMIARYQM